MKHLKKYKIFESEINKTFPRSNNDRIFILKNKITPPSTFTKDNYS